MWGDKNSSFKKAQGIIWDPNWGFLTFPDLKARLGVNPTGKEVKGGKGFYGTTFPFFKKGFLRAGIRLKDGQTI